MPHILCIDMYTTTLTIQAIYNLKNQKSSNSSPIHVNK